MCTEENDVGFNQSALLRLMLMPNVIKYDTCVDDGEKNWHLSLSYTIAHPED